MIKVILSAQDYDANIKRISTKLFSINPNFNSIANLYLDILITQITTVSNLNNKAKSIIYIVII